MELPSQNDYITFLNGHLGELQRVYADIENSDNIKALVANSAGAVQNDTARKNRAQQLIREMNDYAETLNRIISAMEREQASISRFVNTTKEKLKVLYAETKDKKELVELRKEQASDVQNKYAADYHSSVLGLWRPLHPNTRGVLYTVSTVLMLITVAGVGFLVMTNKNRIFPARTTASTFTKGSGPQAPSSLFDDNNYGRVAGGGMKLRLPKK